MAPPSPRFACALALAGALLGARAAAQQAADAPPAAPAEVPQTQPAPAPEFGSESAPAPEQEDAAELARAARREAARARREALAEELLRTPAMPAIAAVLRASRNTGFAPDQGALRVRACLPAGLPAVFALLETCVVPPCQPADAPQALSDPQREILCSALQQCPPDAVLREAQRRWSTPADDAQRRARLQVEGACAGADAIQALFLYAWDGAAQRLPDEVRAALEQAVTRILLRDPAGFARLPTLCARIAPRLRSSLMLAVGETRDPRGLDLMSTLVAHDAELRRGALAQMRRLGRSDDPERNRGARESVRELVLQPVAPIPVDAVLALGALEDSASIGALIELLDFPEYALRDAAHDALQRICGFELPRAASAWRSWYDTELAWHAHELPRELAALQGGNADRAAKALVTLGRHPAWRDEIAEAVLPFLGGAELKVRKLSCRALGTLGSPVALEALVEQLGCGHREIEQAAMEAIEQIAREPLPPAALAWRERERAESAELARERGDSSAVALSEPIAFGTPRGH